MFPPSPCIILSKSTINNKEYRLRLKTSTGLAAARVLGGNKNNTPIRTIKATGRTVQVIATHFPIAIWSCNPNSTLLDGRGNPLVAGSLDSLDCSGNHLGNIDFSGNSGLKRLICASNSLRRLILRAFVPGNSALDIEELDCSKNLLTQLNLSALKHLSWVDCSQNRLSSIVFGNLQLLRSVNCARNKLLTLDLSKVSHLHFVDARSNPIGQKI